jgi:hypothetical protein
MDLNAGNVLAKIKVLVQDNVDFWLLPVSVGVAWFYYPYCENGPGLCLWRAILQLRCPGCGLTRGVCFLVHGRVAEAIHFNPLSVVVLGLMALNFFKSLCELFREARTSCS